MNRVFRYKNDAVTKYATLLHFIIFTVVAILLYYLFEGGYMFAWFISIVVAIILLMLLSIPRYVVLNADSIDICCISDYTHIEYDKIAEVRIVPKKSMRYFLPLFASIGFFGYYGIFLNIRKMDFVKIYSSQLGDCVEITDIYEDKYYISCCDLTALHDELNQAINNATDEA